MDDLFGLLTKIEPASLLVFAAVVSMRLKDHEKRLDKQEAICEKRCVHPLSIVKMKGSQL
jgi:hypothetical protein